MPDALTLLTYAPALLLGVAVVGLVVASFRQAWQAWWGLPTFDQYVHRHPGTFRAGRCHCHRCGSSRIKLIPLDAWHRQHACTDCGTLLFRS
jgi:hypothetical protein